MGKRSDIIFPTSDVVFPASDIVFFISDVIFRHSEAGGMKNRECGNLGMQISKNVCGKKRDVYYFCTGTG